MSDRVLGLSWITDAPIRELKGSEITDAVRVMQENMQGWHDVDVPHDPIPRYLPPAPHQTPDQVRQQQLRRRPPDIDASDWMRPQRTFQERWNSRMHTTNLMLTSSFDRYYTVGYFVSGIPIALMALIASPAPVMVADLVSHPGSDNAGGIMIEYAVNYGQKENDDPQVELTALDEDARRAYLALGFLSKTGTSSQMLLDPPSSPKWARLDSGVWHLAKFGQPQTYIG